MSFFNSHKIGFCLLLIGDVTFALASAELKHDPFAYTEILLAPLDKKLSRNSPIASKVKWQPLLQATIVAGDLSVANVEGKVIRIGEKFDGYTLIKVGSKNATFEKNQIQIVLKMTPKRK